LLILITCSKKRDIVQLPSLLPGQTIGPSGTVPEIPGQLESMIMWIAIDVLARNGRSCDSHSVRK